VAASGVAGLSSSRKLAPELRIFHLVEFLNELADQRNPQVMALCQPSGINWPVPSLDLLMSSLPGWSSAWRFPQLFYTTQLVRTAIAGHPNASRDHLGYAIMLLLGPIGQGRSTHEWEAVAVGHYHLNLVA